MGIVAIPNFSQMKIKFDHGTDLNGERVIKTRTYSSIKSSASNQAIMDVANAIVSLQQHGLSGLNRIDNISIAE